MSDSPQSTNDFLSELAAVVEKHISNERFGVSELADELSMSRSNLLRKVKKETKLSVSQFISQVRLKRAMELLRKTSANVSEVSHQVGFNSTSYFIKCFREYYGYPPGEVGKRESQGTLYSKENPIVNGEERKRKYLLPVALGLILILALGLFAYYGWPSANRNEKSIAVLPFKNDSNDSTNVYLINGLMESTLNNLQQIKDLRIISRTSAEKYRNTSKSIPEMGRELNVSYFVEGSGQKIGDRIVLNIQLIDAATDKQMWTRQYRRETKEIFELQQEIAKNIAEEIEVIITPEEREKIEKEPTADLVAYDYFLKGRDLFYKSGRQDLEASVPWFRKAIAHDPKFGLAYANATLVFYYLDMFQAKKHYLDTVTSYADKAMLYDPKSGESLIAKALDYANHREYQKSVPYLEKALEYNPNSGLVLHFLNEFYSVYVPDPRKHLKYAIMKVKADIVLNDSSTSAFNYFHLSYALFQTGFLEESLLYVNKSLAYDPKSYFSGYFKVYVISATGKDLQQTKELMARELSKDTTRFDIAQELGKICFMLRDYESAYRYYQKFLAAREGMHLDLFQYENVRIAAVYAKKGFKQKAEELLKSFRQYAENDRTMYKHLHWTVYYCYLGDVQKALEHVKLFSQEDNFDYIVTCWDEDPQLDLIKDRPEFKAAMAVIDKKFKKMHDEVAEDLREKKLLLKGKTDKILDRDI
jgi:TolB-like protein/AraC-like DNA-binding protein